MFGTVGRHIRGLWAPVRRGLDRPAPLMVVRTGEYFGRFGVIWAALIFAVRGGGQTLEHAVHELLGTPDFLWLLAAAGGCFVFGALTVRPNLEIVSVVGIFLLLVMYLALSEETGTVGTVGPAVQRLSGVLVFIGGLASFALTGELARTSNTRAWRLLAAWSITVIGMRLTLLPTGFPVAHVMGLALYGVARNMAKTGRGTVLPGMWDWIGGIFAVIAALVLVLWWL